MVPHHRHLGNEDVQHKMGRIDFLGNGERKGRASG
jgi:hypothetical protein